MIENNNYDEAVPEISVETLIEASIGEVWEKVKDIKSHVDWMDDAVSIHFVGAREQGAGTEFDCETQIGPFNLTDRMKITEWSEGKSIGVSHEGLVRGEGQFALSVIEHGITRFTWVESLIFPFWMGGPFRNPVGKKILEHVWQKNLKNLKTLIENEHSSS